MVTLLRAAFATTAFLVALRVSHTTSPHTLILYFQEEFYIMFAEFEEKVKEYDRARAIYK